MAIIKNVGDADYNFNGFLLSKGEQVPVADNKFFSLVMMDRTFHEAIKKGWLEVESANPKVVFIVEDVKKSH